MTEEKRCWFCRRTEKEVIGEAKAMGYYPDYVDEDNAITMGPKMFDTNDSLDICAFCANMFCNIAYDGCKQVIGTAEIKLEL